MQKLMAVNKLLPITEESAVSPPAIACDVRTRHTVRLPPQASTHVPTRQLSPRNCSVNIVSSSALNSKGVTAESEKIEGGVTLRNNSDEVILLQKGQRIAQVILQHGAAPTVVDHALE